MNIEDYRVFKLLFWLESKVITKYASEQNLKTFILKLHEHHEKKIY